MTDSIDPALYQEVVSSVKSIIATVVIGFTVATCLFGISVLQTYFYYRTYPKDHVGLKIMVGVLILLDTLTTTFVLHALYTYSVTNYDDPFANLKIPWSFALESELVDVITLIAQCFFAGQVWRISHNKIVTGLILFLAIGCFAADFPANVLLFTAESAEVLSTRRMLINGATVEACWALCDITITVALIYYLRFARGTSSRAIPKYQLSLVDKVIVYIVNRGLLTAVVQLVFMSTYVAYPHMTYWLPFHQCVAKLYVNSVLGTLNVRRSLFKFEQGDSADHIKQTTIPAEVGVVSIVHHPKLTA